MTAIFKACNRIIEFSFYSLFFFVPLFFTPDTFELFEFNKMWLTFALTIIIAASWFTKMILLKEIRIQRTPLDIPIALFLISQIISTLFSLDIHVSLWGYYSRFNGGLLSIISYIFLYYAFLSNLSDLTKSIVNRLLKISLISGLIVALWGLPSHFGYDPTCFLLRGTFDVSCWTESFQPKVRIFSTLGQPDWLATYLTILIPLSIVMFIKNLKSKEITSIQNQKSSVRQAQDKKIKNQKSLEKLFAICYLLFAILFYLDLLYTDARSGFFAFWLANIIFWFFIFVKKIFPKRTFLKYFLIFNFLFLIANFFVGTPVSQFDKFTYSNIKSQLNKSRLNKELKTTEEKTILYKKIEGGTESGEIRMIVWKGALDIFKHSPLFGSGVETFAFAYYKYRPLEHNLVSEWDYLYNKAHNEYLNYLATTGIFGLGSYLLMIGMFLFMSLKNHKSQITNHKQIQNKNSQKAKRFENSGNWNLFGIWYLEFGILTFALIASYLSILVSNFFGFSVVLVNLYLFLIPAFVFVLQGTINSEKTLIIFKGKMLNQKMANRKSMENLQWIAVSFLLLISFYFLINLFNFWQADKAYALGSNLNKTGQYQQAYLKLHEAIDKRGDEPVFKDELSFNTAVMSLAFMMQKDASLSAEFLKESLNLSNQVVTEYPNNVVFWKTRVRAFYALSQTNPKYLNSALEAIKKANELAPTDAKVSYNLGLLYQQNGQTEKAIEVLEKTIKLKPDYKDAYYALGIYYRELAKDKNGNLADYKMAKKATDILKFILSNIAPNDGQTKEALKTWGEL